MRNPNREGDKPIRCPACRKKLMLHLEFGVGRVWCKDCKVAFSVDRKPMANVM